jgi:hypothetical protein
MKQCIDCKETKPIAEFGNRGGKRKDKNVRCKICDVAKTREYRAKSRRWVGEFKMKEGCKHCDFKAVIPAQLQLDHRDPSSKTKNGNGRAYEPSWSRVRILAEIDKCDVLCANCHALKTFSNKEHIN